jgi:peptide/nickel transport system ATP-binding protein
MSATDLLAAAPAVANDRGGAQQPLLIVRELKKYFSAKTRFLSLRTEKVQAVDGVSFSIAKGSTLGVVGESGCGKSTTARLLLHLIEPDAGEIIFDGEAVGANDGISVRGLRLAAQMVFQDSYSSLNPRATIGDIIAFGPRAARGVAPRSAQQRAENLLEQVGLRASLFARRYPHELSGGQRQRVNIARALALEPRLLILDEAVSALDKSVEAQILNLLADLRRDLGLTYLFISHDLNVVRHVSDRVVVMYLGRIVETGDVDAIFHRPLHPYTQALLRAMPSMDPDRRTSEPPLTGDPPNPINPPSGCRFRTRCVFAETVCARVSPVLAEAKSAIGNSEDGNDLLRPSRFSGGGDRADREHKVACHMMVTGSGHSRAGAEAFGHD